MGNICEWSRIKEIANKYNLLLIEDSADTLGATMKMVIQVVTLLICQ